MSKHKVTEADKKKIEETIHNLMKDRYESKKSDAPLVKAFKEYSFHGDNYEFNNQIVYRFPNGLGASVIDGRGSEGLELIGIRFPYEDEPREYEFIKKSQVGYLTPERLEEILREIYNKK